MNSRLNGRVERLETLFPEIDNEPGPYEDTFLFTFRRLYACVEAGQVVEHPPEYQNVGHPHIEFRVGYVEYGYWMVVQEIIRDMAVETGWRSQHGRSYPSWVDYRPNTLQELKWWLDVLIQGYLVLYGERRPPLMN